MKITFKKGQKDISSRPSNKIYDAAVTGVLVRLSDDKRSKGVMIAEGTDDNIIIKILNNTKCTIITTVL